MMIVTVEPKEYVPCGQLALLQHPGLLSLDINKHDAAFQGARSLLGTFSQVSLSDTPKEEMVWKLRMKDGLTEELFFSGHTLFWSRGFTVLKSFTVEGPIKHAVWSEYICKEEDPYCFNLPRTPRDQCKKLVGVSIVCDDVMLTYGECGQDYVTSLPFEVKNVWSFRYGLLYERKSSGFGGGCKEWKNTGGAGDGGACEAEPARIFSLKHPAREIYPVISKSQGFVRYMNKDQDRIVYCDDDFVLTCDAQTGVHTVWRAREIIADDSNALDALNSISQPNTNLQSTASPSVPSPTGFRRSSGALRSTPKPASHGSHPNMGMMTSSGGMHTTTTSSTTAKTPRNNSTRSSRLSQHSTRHFSPASTSHFQSNMMSPIRQSPHNKWTTPNSHMSRDSCRDVTINNVIEALTEPLRPEICFDHMWSESSVHLRCGLDIGQARKVFRVKDMCGQNYLCYLIDTLSQLRLVRYTSSNDQWQLVFGAVTCLQAKDAAPLKTLNMIAVLDFSGFITLYTGKTKVQKMNLNGLPSLSGNQLLSAGGSSSSSTIPQPISTPANSNRLRSTMANIADESLLSPVIEADVSDLENISINTVDDFGYLTNHGLGSGSHCRPVAFQDVAGSNIILELNNASLYRLEIPSICSTQLVQTCLDALRSVLPSDQFMKLNIKWYCIRHAPGSLDGNKLEWNLLVNCLHDFLYSSNRFGSMCHSKRSVFCESSHFHDSSTSPVVAAKKARQIQASKNESWDYMMNSKFHKQMTGQCFESKSIRANDEDIYSNIFINSMNASTQRRASLEGSISADSSNHLTLQIITSAFCALHLVFEEQKLNVLTWSNAGLMAPFLYQLANDIGQRRFLPTYVQANPSLTKSYVLNGKQNDANKSMDEDFDLKAPGTFSSEMIPCVFENILQLVTKGKLKAPFVYLPEVTPHVERILKVYECLFSDKTSPVLTAFLPMMRTSFNMSLSGERDSKSQELLKYQVTNRMKSDEVEKEKCKCILKYMSALDITNDELESWPKGVLFPIQHIFFKYASDPDLNLSSKAFNLLGRTDLLSQTIDNAGDWESAGLSPSTDPMKYRWTGGLADDTLIPGCSDDADITKLIKFFERHAKNAASNPDSWSDQADALENEPIPADDNVTRLLFPKDHRMEDVRRMLDTSIPVHIHLVQDQRIDDHEFTDQKQHKALQLANRTMALAIGRGMAYFRTEIPSVARGVEVVKLKLSARYIDPTNTNSAEASSNAQLRANVEVDLSSDITEWSRFHNGVAAALAIRTDEEEAGWIHLTRPSTTSISPYDLEGRENLKKKKEEPSYEHAGTMMGLGLNQHLHDFQALNVHSYLKLAHDLTTIGILLGVATDKCGTCDREVLRMITVHLPIMLPVQVSQMDIPHKVQTAALVGLGLLYLGSGTHLVAEILLKEIDCSPMGENETTPDREAYSLSAGFALGLVALGMGEDCPNLGDLSISNKLYHYMTGSHRIRSTIHGMHPPSDLPDFELSKASEKDGQILEGDRYNTEVTGPAAMMALALIYLKTNNSFVAEWFNPPQTLLLLERVKPQHLLLQILVHSLIMWDQVEPTKEWVCSHIPDVLKRFLPTEENIMPFVKECTKHYQSGAEYRLALDYDEITIVQSYVAIISGACLSIGFRFAGSQHKCAFETILHYVDFLLSLAKGTGNNSMITDILGRRFYDTCFSSCLLGLTMVVAGSGNIKALQRCRFVHYNITGDVCYGTQMAAHMALGFLFLGRCRYTLKTSNKAIAGLLMAVYPCFPGRPEDNRYHLQALRHMYVIATEKRLLVPIDVETKRPCYARVMLHYLPSKSHDDGARISLYAPCLLPDFNLLQSVTVDDPRHWRINLDVKTQRAKLESFINDGIYVQRFANCLPYIRDTKGYTRCSGLTQKILKSTKLDDDLLAVTDRLCLEEQKNEFLPHAAQLIRSHHIPAKTAAPFLSFLQTCANLERDVLVKPLSVMQIILAQNYTRYLVKSAASKVDSRSSDGELQMVTSMNNIISVKLAECFRNFEKEHANLIQGFLANNGGVTSSRPHHSDQSLSFRSSLRDMCEIFDTCQPKHLCKLACYAVYSQLRSSLSEKSADMEMNEADDEIDMMLEEEPVPESLLEALRMLKTVRI